MRALHRLPPGPPPEVLLDAVGAVSPGDTLAIDASSARLVTLGYARLPAAADPGDFAVRGGIVDVYSPAHPLPARLLLGGDGAESGRGFHPAAPRTARRGRRAGAGGGFPGAQDLGGPESEVLAALSDVLILLSDGIEAPHFGLRAPLRGD